MPTRINVRAAGLALGMVALLLLAACSGALPTEQVSERLPAGTPAESGEVAPTDTAAPTATSTGAPSEPAEVAPTDTSAPTATDAEAEQEYQIVTLLPPEAIPSIDNPRFYGVGEADEEYQPQELVLGVELDGEARAYSVSLLSGHEIVNDTLAGRPIAVTW